MNNNACWVINNPSVPFSILGGLAYMAISLKVMPIIKRRKELGEIKDD